MSVFTKRLRDFRLKASLSQEKLGVLAGIDEASASARMNQYEKGKHEPDYTMVQRIARALNLPAAIFYAEEDSEAELLEAFGRLSSGEKEAVIEMTRELLSKKDEKCCGH